mgnify:CR=1 FL=1
MPAAGLVLASDGDAHLTFDAMKRLVTVRGRIERAAITPSGAPVYVDYAHTPDSLEKLYKVFHPSHIIGVLGGTGGGPSGASSRSSVGSCVGGSV